MAGRVVVQELDAPTVALQVHQPKARAFDLEDPGGRVVADVESTNLAKAESFAIEREGSIEIADTDAEMREPEFCHGRRPLLQN